MTLPNDARKSLPIYTGVLRYFPEAIAAVAHVSQVGNDQHHPGQPLHWDRTKSTDERDACVRHLLEAGTFDTDGVRHSAKAAWRALAALQKEIEADGGKIHDVAGVRVPPPVAVRDHRGELDAFIDACREPSKRQWPALRKFRSTSVRTDCPDCDGLRAIALTDGRGWCNVCESCQSPKSAT